MRRMLGRRGRRGLRGITRRRSPGCEGVIPGRSRMLMLCAMGASRRTGLASTGSMTSLSWAGGSAGCRPLTSIVRRLAARVPAFSFSIITTTLAGTPSAMNSRSPDGRCYATGARWRSIVPDRTTPRLRGSSRRWGSMSPGCERRWSSASFIASTGCSAGCSSTRRPLGLTSSWSVRGWCGRPSCWRIRRSPRRRAWTTRGSTRAWSITCRGCLRMRRNTGLPRSVTATFCAMWRRSIRR